jgi:hypothetical protein
MQNQTHSKRPLALSLFAAFCCACLPACGGLHSDLTVPTRETFVLGGGQNGSFKVKAKNKGNVAVSVAARSATGTVTDLGTLAPGSTQSLNFPAGSAALIRNASTANARLDLHVTGNVPSAMDYEKPSAAEKN